MARIRTVKPEFWDSPGIETLEPEWRLLYIAMWNWADDTGRGKAEARELMGFVFPRDEEMTVGEFRRGLGEVRRVFGVEFYRVEGRAYFAIHSWDRHQKIDKRSGSKYPAPSEGQPLDPVTNMLFSPQFGGDSAETHEDPPRSRRNLGAGTGEQGNRGTGEQRTNDQPSGPIMFDNFWAAYPRKVGKKSAERKYVAAVKRAGGEHIVVDGARRMAEDPNLPEQRYIPHPTTWLDRDGWDDEPLPPQFGRRDSGGANDGPLDLLEVARGMNPQSNVSFIDADYEVREIS